MEIKGCDGDSVTTEWGTLEIDMSYCGLTEEKISVIEQEVEKRVKASQRRGDLSQFLKMVRICKAGNKGIGSEEREGEVLATCVVFALKSSTHSKAGLLPPQRRWYLSLCTEFPSESGLLNCICLQGRSTEN